MKNPLTKDGIRTYKSFEEAEKGEYIISGRKSAVEGLKDTIDLTARAYEYTKEELDSLPYNFILRIISYKKFPKQ